MGANAGDRLQLRVGAVDEPVDRAEVERESAACRAGRRSRRPHAMYLHSGSSTPCVGGVASAGSCDGASRLRPTTIPVAAEAAASPVPMTTCRRVPAGPHDDRLSVCEASPICSASRRCRSVTNSSRGESLPVRRRATRWPSSSRAASTSSGRARSVRWPRSRPSTKRRTGSSAHSAPSSLICAAIRSARCCNTLAFATLTPIWPAASRTEKACRKRSSRMRR